MTTESTTPPPKVYRLSAQSKGAQEVRVPEFPCWLWDDAVKVWSDSKDVEIRYGKYVHRNYSHWTPSATRPTAAPDTTTTEGDECGPIREGEGLRTPPAMTTASVEGETMKLELVAPRTEDEMRKHGQSCDTLIGHERWMIEWATTLERENTELRRKVGELEGDAKRYHFLRLHWETWTGNTWRGNEEEIAAKLDSALDYQINPPTK